MDNVVRAVLRGDTAIFVSGSDQAIVVSSKHFPVRGIEESSTEGGMRGPRDSFNENFRTSTALIRRRIKDVHLKLEQGTMGVRSRTEYGIFYMEDIAEPELVQQIRDTIDKYEIDAVFDSGMAEHLMEKKWQEIFPIYQATTRPDKAAAALVEGRVVVVFDNSPEVIIAPATINTLFQTADDYYNRWPVATFARMIRYVAAFIAVGLPGLYIAITCYHRELIPDKLLYAIADARSQLSFPVVVEVLIMELLFELLREAGIRLPSQLGNTIGVVGGLIVGQSAVEAGIVSTMVVIVVALTAIASFAIPNEAFASVFRLLKFVQAAVRNQLLYRNSHKRYRWKRQHRHCFFPLCYPQIVQPLAHIHQKSPLTRMILPVYTAQGGFSIIISSNFCTFLPFHINPHNPSGS